MINKHRKKMGDNSYLINGLIFEAP